MIPELGVIESYFGRPWKDGDRKHVLARLRELQFSFFHYAPRSCAGVGASRTLTLKGLNCGPAAGQQTDERETRRPDAVTDICCPTGPRVVVPFALAVQEQAP